MKGCTYSYCTYSYSKKVITYNAKHYELTIQLIFFLQFKKLSDLFNCYSMFQLMSLSCTMRIFRVSFSMVNPVSITAFALDHLSLEHSLVFFLSIWRNLLVIWLLMLKKSLFFLNPVLFNMGQSLALRGLTIEWLTL